MLSNTIVHITTTTTTVTVSYYEPLNHTAGGSIDALVLCTYSTVLYCRVISSILKLEGAGNRQMFWEGEGCKHAQRANLH